MALDIDTINSQYKKHTERDEPAEGQEVFADLNVPFERPAEQFVPGPFYKNVEEVLPELGEVEDVSFSTIKDEPTSELAVDRRDFMRLFSASALVGTAAACVRRPEEKAIPYVNQPMDHAISEATHYASTCGECYAGCGVAVKTREGRPTKIEGLAEHVVSQGATCALGQSTLQALYHPERRKKPLQTVAGRREDAEWEEIFERLGSRLSKAKNVAILTNGSTGHRHRFYEEFLTRIGGDSKRLYTYEANGLLTALIKAHEIAFGVSGYPRADLRSAQLIVGIGSDFLDVGTSPVFNTKNYASSHVFRNGQMGKLIQFESVLTNTGARAHERFPIAPGSEILVALMLCQSLIKNPASKGSAGERSEIEKALQTYSAQIASARSELGDVAQQIDRVAEELLSDKSVVLCGSSATDANSTSLQLVSIMINTLIGAYGSTLFLDRGWAQAPVRTGDLHRFISDAANIDLLLIIESNPVFTVPESFGIKDLLKKIPTVVSIQHQNTETDSYAEFVLNGRHYLESWGDEQPFAGVWSMRQPAVRPLTDSRQAEDILLWLAAAVGKPMKYREYREYLSERMEAVHKVVGVDIDYETFWRALLRRGFIEKIEKRTVPSMGSVAHQIQVQPATKGLKLISPLDIRLHDGRGADRPVLQDVGDAMSTIAWDTWVALNPKTAKALGFKRNDVLRLETAAGSVEVALFPMPGLHPDAVEIKRGNGRFLGVNKVTDGYGVNPTPLFGSDVDPISQNPCFSNVSVKLVATGKIYRLATQQKHNDIANRADIIKKVTVAEAAEGMAKVKDLDTVPDLYPKLKESPDYRWGLAIDLTACNGCSACMVACAVENNVPQIGRQQILKGREMHWIRLDRYFAGSVDNPEVTIQPVMCQHCNHAPCEGVCPVFATAHDPEGFNGMTYNRCVGTRYCANACPYKVRRFNWFTHKWNVVGDSELNRNLRALNPDVTVRTRGVMEKCSFCIQRIRDAKHKAKERGGLVRDGEIRTACQQVCPSNAITFGNLKDRDSRVAHLRSDNRAFLMLNGDPEHKHYGLKTLPNVSYLAEVTHKPSVINAHKSGHHGVPKDAAGHGASEEK